MENNKKNIEFGRRLKKGETLTVASKVSYTLKKNYLGEEI